MSEEPRGALLTPGTEIDGFVIESVAGRGGMGVVYRARQRRPDRVVALKVIAPDLVDNPAFRTRFEHEAGIAASIEHPNVIPVYAIGEAAGTLYIAMRFVDGIDLGSLIQRERRLEPARAAAIVDGAARALDAAHAHGLVHRDVKPANILLTPVSGRDHVYLTDFGLSRYVQSATHVTRTGVVIGTPDYISPEQVRGEPVEARSDVYSLGCVLFAALTGDVPFNVESDLSKLYAHDTKPPPSLHDRVTGLPDALDTVVARALAKAPEDRFRSAGDLGRAAVAAAAGEEPSASERSVAVGAAAPGAGATTGLELGDDALLGATQPEPARVAPRRMPRRALIVSVAVLVAAVPAVVLLAGGGDGGGGGGGGKDESTAGLAVIPAGSRTSNPSFEDGLSGWEGTDSRLARLSASDAAHGERVVRVTSTVSAREYGIDDAPDSIASTTAGQEYTAIALGEGNSLHRHQDRLHCAARAVGRRQAAGGERHRVDDGGRR